MALRFPQSMLVPNFLGLSMEILYADVNVHFCRCQVHMAYPFLNHCGMSAPSVQGVADMGVAERMD